MKTQFLLLAFVAFFLLTGNVNARGTEHETASSHETFEPALEIEAWMLDTNYPVNPEIFAEESENELVIESWMTEEKATDNNKICYSEETEKELEIESWMYKTII